MDYASNWSIEREREREHIFLFIFTHGLKKRLICESATRDSSHRSPVKIIFYRCLPYEAEHKTQTIFTGKLLKDPIVKIIFPKPSLPLSSPLRPLFNHVLSPLKPPSPSINQVCRRRKIGGGNICGEGWTFPLSPLPCSQEAVAMAKWRCGGVGGCGCAITALGRSGSTSGLVGNSFPSSFATTVSPIDKLCWGGFIGNNLGNTGSICCGLWSGGRRQRCSMKVMMVVGRSRWGEVINGVGGWIQMRQGSSKRMKLGEPCMQQEPCLRSTSCLQILGHSSSLLAFENHLIRLQEDLVFALEEDLHAK